MTLIDKYDANGIHVHAWTFFIAVGSLILALLGILFSSLGLLDLALHNKTMIAPFHFEQAFLDESAVIYIQAIEVLIKSILLLFVSSLLVYANRVLKPSLYWPFIIHSVISMSLFAIRLVLLVDIEMYIWIRDFNKTPKVIIQEQKYSSYTALIVIIFACLGIQGLFYRIVQRGREYLIELEKDKKIRNLNVE